MTNATTSRTYELMTKNPFTPEGMMTCTEVAPNGDKKFFFVIRRNEVDIVESKNQGDLYAALESFGG